MELTFLSLSFPICNNPHFVGFYEASLIHSANTYKRIFMGQAQY